MTSLRIPVELLRLLLQRHADPVFVVDTESGRLIDCNESAATALGYTREELLELTVSDFDVLLPPERYRLLARKPACETFEGVTRYRRKDGETFPVRLTAISRTIDGVAVSVAMARDISADEDHERVLREAFLAEHERYQMVVTATRQVVHEWVEGRPEIAWGGSIKDVLGYSAEEHGGTFVDWLKRVHPEDRARVIAIGKEARAQRKQLLTYEYRYLHADGRYRWIWNHNLYEWDDRGRARRVIGVMQDVTARKELEAQVHSAQRMETIGALADGVAHDVNNYLTTVMGNVELALMRLDEPWEELLDAREAVRGCAELVRSLLTFARQKEPQRVELEVGEVVTHAVRILARLVGPEIQLRSRTEEGLLFKADAVQVQQVLMNLVVNARDAMEGRGTIVVSAERTDDGYIRFSVQDSGPGVPPELAQRIFEPYFSTRPQGNGTGLGLSIVHGVAVAHRGRVEVTNNTSRPGATFSVYFPAL